MNFRRRGPAGIISKGVTFHEEDTVRILVFAAAREHAGHDGAGALAEGTVKIAMLPKFKGENYFDACKVGAQEGIDELNKDAKVVEFLYDGPSQDQATNQKQVDILEGWIAQQVNVIIVSPNDPVAIAPTLKKAMEKGIKVLTFDADAQADARQLFVNQVASDGVAKGLVEGTAAKLIAKGYGPEKPANIGVVSSAKTDANQQAWLASIKALLATDEYKWMVLKNEDTDVYYPGPDETATQTQAGILISRMGPGADQIQAAIALTSMATPALGSQYSAASVKPDPTTVTLTGWPPPTRSKSYIKDDANPWTRAYCGTAWTWGTWRCSAATRWRPARSPIAPPPSPRAAWATARSRTRWSSSGRAGVRQGQVDDFKLLIRSGDRHGGLCHTFGYGTIP